MTTSIGRLSVALALALFAVLAIDRAAHAAEPVSTGLFSSTAIGGKDTVSYHSDAVRQSHRAADGQSNFEVKYLGATWRFASKASADKFAASPAAFVPQYNGHCANALSTGEGLVRTNGEVWEFFGDKLYLFYAESGRQRWLKGDWQAYRREADAAWQAIARKW
jgi:YHS domain-containing protein